MQNIKLLDCTLRDGGYLNNWHFGNYLIRGVCRGLSEANVDFVEVGFLDSSAQVDLDYTKLPSIESFNKSLNNINFNKTIPVAMIDYGHFDINNLPHSKKSLIKAIRVIFKKDKIPEALKFCKKIKDKGYMLFVQAVSITSYSNKEIIDYIKKINVLKPYAFSIVDTYGLLNNEILDKYLKIFEKYLDRNICIGYHAHNNFQLAFSNSLEFIKTHSTHNLIVDSTIYGMGKSAGNCPTELMVMELNRRFGSKYDQNRILDLIDTYIYSLQAKHQWGYKYNFFISSMNSCHPDYVKYLLDKKTVSISAINKILDKIPQKNKLNFDKGLIDNLYFDFQSNSINDDKAISFITKKIKDKAILVIGPGSSIVSEKLKISKFIKENKPIIFSINFLPEQYNIKYCFVSNSIRYKNLEDQYKKGREIIYILTSNILSNNNFCNYVVDYSRLLNPLFYNIDNSLLLLINLLIRCKAKRAVLAGFDGFKGSKDYYDDKYDFRDNTKYKINNNSLIKKNLSAASRFLKIKFLTKSLYE